MEAINVKVEGIVYFIGLALGTWMIYSFHNTAKLVAVIGGIFAFLGLFGYYMMFYMWRHKK